MYLVHELSTNIPETSSIHETIINCSSYRKCYKFFREIWTLPEKFFAEGAEGRLPEEFRDQSVAPYNVHFVVLNRASSLGNWTTDIVFVRWRRWRRGDVSSWHSGPVHVSLFRGRHRQQVRGVQHGYPCPEIVTNRSEFQNFDRFFVRNKNHLENLKQRKFSWILISSLTIINI